MQDIKLIKDTKGWYSCDVPISKDDWTRFLSDKSVASEPAMTALLSFYYMPGYAASCTMVSEEYGRKPAYYVGSINGFCRNVQKRFTDFRILSHDSDEQTFWPVCMARGKNATDGFVWYLRPELIEALRDRVVTLHVEQYARDKSLLKALGIDCTDEDSVPVVPCVILYPVLAERNDKPFRFTMSQKLKRTLKFYKCPIPVPLIKSGTNK